MLMEKLKALKQSFITEKKKHIKRPKPPKYYRNTFNYKKQQKHQKKIQLPYTEIA